MSNVASTSKKSKDLENRKEVKRINKCKNYYEILGVSAVTATETNIKNAYYKIALKIHPDKNKHSGAEDAFKQLGKAKDTLSDPYKRLHYDLSRYTLDSSRDNTSNRHSHQEENSFSGGFQQYTHYNQYRQERRDSSQRGQEERRRDPPQENRDHDSNNYFWYLLAIAFVVLLVALYNVPPNTQKSSKTTDPFYSLKATKDFSVVRRTLNQKVRYYVGNTFARRFRGSSLDKLEDTIEKEYLKDLERSCAEQKSYLLIRQMYRKVQSWIMFETDDEVRMPACKKLENFDKRFFRL